VTYGPFAPEDASGGEYHDAASVERDFAAIAALGANCVRTYTMPPSWLLDIAQRHGLYVMVGPAVGAARRLPRHPPPRRDIVRRVREMVRAVAGHPAILCYTIGNEIPSHIVRWYGHRKVERYLERSYRAVKREDPGRAGHLCQLPVDRIPRSPVRRSRLLSTSTSNRRTSCRVIWRGCRTSRAIVRY
jgi:beta-galactosidase/beta-glucuronidase